MRMFGEVTTVKNTVVVRDVTDAKELRARGYVWDDFDLAWKKKVSTQQEAIDELRFLAPRSHTFVGLPALVVRKKGKDIGLSEEDVKRLIWVG